MPCYFGRRYVSEVLNPFICNVDNAWEKFSAEILAEITSDAKENSNAVTPAPPLATAWGKENVSILNIDIAEITAKCHVQLAVKMNCNQVIGVAAEDKFAKCLAKYCETYHLKCLLYMGGKDFNESSIKNTKINIKAVRTPEGHYEQALTEALRNYTGSDEKTYLAIGSAIGPHPYPQIYIDAITAYVEKLNIQPFDTVIGVSGVESIPAPILQKLGKTIVLAEAENAQTLSKGVEGILHGMLTLLLRDNNGQITTANAISSAMRYPAAVPVNADYYKNDKLKVVSVSDDEALNVIKTTPFTELTNKQAYACAAAKKFAGKNILIDISNGGCTHD